VLEVSDLSVSYGAVSALKGVSLDASSGSITAVLGANGAGKTTLLRAISGLVKSQSGSAKFADRELIGMSVEDIVRVGVSHVPEGGAVIVEMTVEENLQLGAVWKYGRRERQRRIAEIYEIFPALAERSKQHASTLSGGERQMLALGRALVSRPSLLLLDEPSLGLAPIVTAGLMAVLADLSKGGDLTTVLVEQNARSALSIASWAIVLNLGTVVVSQPAEKVAGDADLRHHFLGF
jgi:branched-chain amino acid transport system ATP-binding protein